MDSPYARELTVAFEALQGAAQLSQSLVASDDTGVVEKEDLSPVTVADFAIQALLTAAVKHAFPGDRCVGEEDASSLRASETLLERVWGLVRHVRPGPLPASREQMCDLIDEAAAISPGGQLSGRTWVFDPIDGTKTYLRGELYAINVALLVDGGQALGAVGCPNLPLDARDPVRNRDVDPAGQGCIVFAVKGHGAYVRPRRLPHLAASPRRDGSDAIRLVGCVGLLDSGLDGVHEAVAERLGATSPGCDLVPWVLRWAFLALGLANATVWVYRRRDRFAKAWDHAGAMLLFEETGGKITDVHGKPINLAAGRTMTANVGFVAAPEALQGRVLDAVHQALHEQGHEEMLA